MDGRVTIGVEIGQANVIKCPSHMSFVLSQRPDKAAVPTGNIDQIKYKAARLSS